MSKKNSLLLVEDDQLLGPLYLHLLGDAGYVVTHCRTASETEEMVLKKKFDLVLLDVMLPDLSGLELLSRFYRLVPVPVVLLTNLDQPQVKEKALQFGALGCLIKSEYTPDEFLDRIAYYLASVSNFR